MNPLPQGSCCICLSPACTPKGRICWACKKRASRRNGMICQSSDHVGDRIQPKTSFTYGKNSCRACLSIQDKRTRNKIPDEPATDYGSDPAYADHRKLIVSLLLGRHL